MPPAYKTTPPPDYEVVQGDTEDPLDVTLEDQDPVTGEMTPANVTGAAILFHGAGPSGPPWSFAGTIIDGPTGQVAKIWTTVQTAALVAGLHKFWITVTFSGGRVKTYPRVDTGLSMNVIPTS